MRVVITGGHISPALSVIEEKPNDWEVFFVGRKSSFEGDKSPSLEEKEIRARDVSFIALPSARFQRKFTLYTVPSLVKAPYALARSFQILKKIKPDAILGFGGYISLPICVAARFLNIPVVIHEQTLEAGAANKIISRWAKIVCLSWPASKDFFPGKNVVLTGNPIRKEILESSQIQAKNTRPIIYITGGSTGSHFINSLVLQSLEELLKDYTVVHQTGDSRKYKDFDKLLEIKNKLPESLAKNYAVSKFVQTSEIGQILSRATLVVGRAGINTITELLYLDKPCLLIPLPIAGRNEQVKNALFAKNLGLAEVLEQDKISIQSFLTKIKYMIDRLDKYKLTSDANLIDKKAAENIVSVVNDVGQKK